MNILLIDTATPVCTVALVRNKVLLAERHSCEHNAHSANLSIFIDQVMRESSMKFNDLDGVCVSSGPGSYTGLRIGVSSAKGLCYALQKPLVSVPTLMAMAASCFEQHPEFGGLVCPMVDARRMECYTAFYSMGPNGIPVEERGVAADIIESGIYDEYLDRGEVLFVGDGAEKTRSVLSAHANARYDEAFQLSAAAMYREAERKLQNELVEDVAYFEPFYLKDFVAKKSEVHGLRPNTDK